MISTSSKTAAMACRRLKPGAPIRKFCHSPSIMPSTGLTIHSPIRKPFRSIALRSGISFASISVSTCILHFGLMDHACSRHVVPHRGRHNSGRFSECNQRFRIVTVRSMSGQISPPFLWAPINKVINQMRVIDLARIIAGLFHELDTLISEVR